MKHTKVLLALLLCFGLVVGCSDKKDNEKTKIGIVQISEHESLNIIREAFIKQLDKKGYNKDNSEIIYKNANGDMSSLKTIVEQFKGDDVDIIIPISTPCAQVAAPYAEKIPVVFAAVSDPISAGLVKELDKTDGNITGTSNEIQVDQILDIGLQVAPNVKKIGVLYNSGEVNSMSAIEKVKQYAKTHNLEVIESTVTGTADVQSATQYLIDNADAIFIPNDNTIINAMDVVTPLTRNAKIPTFCGVDTFVKAGGLLNVGIDYNEIGKETANMAIQVINGTPVSDIPIKVFKKNLNLYINKTTASDLDIDISHIKTEDPIIYFE